MKLYNYLRIKYANKTVNSIIPKGSIQRQTLLNNTLKWKKNNGKSQYIPNPINLAEQRLNRSNSTFGDAYKPKQITLSGNNFSPASQGIIAQRDISKALKGKVSKKKRKEIARNAFKSQMWSPENVDEFHKLLKNDGVGRINSGIEASKRNAKGADAIQYLITNSIHNPAQKKYIQTIPVIDGAIGAYSPDKDNILVPTDNHSTAHTVGHEVGHALYGTRKLPKQLTQAMSAIRQGTGIASPELPDNNKVVDRFKDKEQASLMLRLLDEVGANQQYNSTMRRALKDNQELYKRFSQNTATATLPAFATYVYGRENKIEDGISKLPKSLKRRATEYMNQYSQYRDKITKHYAKKGIQGQEAMDKAYKLYDRVANRQDPKLFDDIYDYAVQKGMENNPNAWYNRPEYNKPISKPLDAVVNYSAPDEFIAQNYGR